MQAEINTAVESRAMNTRITSFLKANTNLTLATCQDNVPACANCFYAFEEDGSYLVFKSGAETNHIKQALENSRVAGSVTPDKLETGRIQGIQFKGSFFEPVNELADLLSKVYYKKFPFAKVFSGRIWAVELEYIKMTDNTLGFGKKIEWSAKASVQNKQ